VLAIGSRSEAGQRNVFLVCAAPLYLYVLIAFGLNATRPVFKATTSEQS